MTLNHNLLQILASLAPDCDNNQLALLFPERTEQSEILLAVRPDEFSATKIAQAVEDCDLHLVNMSVTSARTPDGNLVIALCIGSATPDAACRSLSRYGYEILASAGTNQTVDDDDARQRAAELLYILNI